MSPPVYRLRSRPARSIRAGGIRDRIWTLPSRQRVSVIVPVHNSADTLRQCLECLARSTPAPFETIVVDDGSTDASASVAQAASAIVLETRSRVGPARARNVGAQRAAGDVLFFLDADVCVRPTTVGQVQAAFEADESLDALIGSYDDSPGSKDFLSEYKNLMHSFVHQTGRHEASTFWSGCGAARRTVFLEHSGFDERYGRPAIEDIELGYRMRRAGRKILLDPELQVTHLKRWTFLGLLKTDVLDRGIPWTELILRDQNMPNDLNLQLSQRVSVALAYVLLGFAAACAIQWRGYFLAPLFAALFFLLGRYWLDADEKPWSVVLSMTLGAGTIIGLAYQEHMLGLIPAMVLGYAVLFVRHRYAGPIESERPWTRYLLGAAIACCFVFILSYLPAHPLILAFLTIFAAMVVLNNEFYIFLAAKRGRLFAVAAVPFHLMYHLYNGISFVVGVCRFAVRSLAGRLKQPTAD
jgi:cellulose synthase/poly-beta-1,6-N-acetylglucosamine synthase-like glycosyltransferase